MTFTTPFALSLLLLVPLMLVFMRWRSHLYSQRLRQLGESRLTALLYSPADSTRRRVKVALWLVTLSVLVIAIARPVWGVRADVIETQGASVFIVLDVSRSMDAQDLSPSRLERARLNIRQLIEGIEGNEIGLIVFAGRAFIQFPLTTDARSALTFVNSADSGSVSQQGTNIAEALNLALGSYNASSSDNRMIILLSDGEEFEGDVLAAVAKAKTQGVEIYAVGYGDTEGQPIPIIDLQTGTPGYLTDANNNLILTHLDESTLRVIAQQTGGQYWRAAANGQNTSELIALVNQSNGDLLSAQVETRPVERFGLIVALALLTLSLEIMLQDSKQETAQA